MPSRAFSEAIQPVSFFENYATGRLIAASLKISQGILCANEAIA